MSEIRAGACEIHLFCLVSGREVNSGPLADLRSAAPAPGHVSDAPRPTQDQGKSEKEWILCLVSLEPESKWGNYFSFFCQETLCWLRLNRRNALINTLRSCLTALTPQPVLIVMNGPPMQGYYR